MRIYELLMFLSFIFPGRQDWKAKYLKWRQERSNLNPSWSNCDIKMPVKKVDIKWYYFKKRQLNSIFENDETRDEKLK